MKRKDAIVGIGLLLAGCSSATPIPTSTPPNTPEGKLRALLAAGGAISLPAGTWVVNDPALYVPAGTTVRGAGIGQTILMYTGTGSLINDAPNVTISDLTLDGSLCPGIAPVQIGVTLVFLSNNSTLRRVRMQNAPSFGAFVYGGSPTIQSCQFDNCCRTNGADALGSDHSDGPVLYDSNVFTRCRNNSIDNCGPLTGIWSNNSVLSIAPIHGTDAGDIIVDGGCSGVIVRNNTLMVGGIQVYNATGCGGGEPHGSQIIDNVIQNGTICDTPLCPGLYIVPGYNNTHHGNVIAGVTVD